MRFGRLLIVIGLLAGLIPLMPVRVTVADDAVVGTGSAASCTEEAFNAAFDTALTNGGGVITFDCGGAATIDFTSQKVVTAPNDVIIDGANQITLDGGDQTRLFMVEADAALDVRNLTFQNGRHSTQGGAIFNSQGRLFVTSSTFVNNRVDGNGAFGGAIATAGGTAKITASTFTGNQSVRSGGAVNIASGQVEIIASTFTGNDGGVWGGGVYKAGGTVAIVGSTIVANSSGIGGGVVLDGPGLLTFQSTIVALNVAGNPFNCRAFVGSFTSLGSNLGDGGGCAFNEPSDINPSGAIDLNALANNGGPTQTMLPQSSSDAIDNADCGLSTTYDQRGALRPGTNCDIGAVEVGAQIAAIQLLMVRNDGPIDEVGTTMIHSAGYSPGGASLTYAIDCDNNGGYETSGDAFGSGSCAFSDDGVYTVGVQVCDDDTPANCAADTTEVTVNNVDPTITDVTNDGPVDEGGSATITVTASDPAGVNDPLQYEFDCDNSGGYEVGPQASNSTLCSFSDNGSFTVPVRVTDGDGGEATGSTTVTVNNVDPTITDVANNGPIDEGSPATITVTATDPAGVNDPLMYEFDCDNDSTYEIPPQVGNSTSCSFADEGSFTVAVRVTDGDGGSATDSTSVTVNNVLPSVSLPSVDIEPSDEGQSVVASVTFTDPGTLDTHTCTVDYDDGDGPVAGTVTEEAGSGTCTGPAHTYVDDDPTGTASDPYTIAVQVYDDEGSFVGQTSTHTVNNVAPVIASVTTNGPVPQGQPVTVTVDASDAGINDILTYSFDCDNDGGYEIGPQASNETTCTLDPGAATATIGVLVEDDDLGVTTGTASVGQTMTLCLSYSTGAVSVPGAMGCGSGTIALTVPGPYATTFCINPYTGAMIWSPGGNCSGSYQPHIVPGDGPLNYCQSVWTGKLRVPRLPGQCTASEIPGVIPG